MRKQLLSFGDEPCELVKSYYPLELARGTAMMARAKIKGGTPTLLADMGYPPVRTDDDVTAEEPTSEEYETLRLPRQNPVLRTFRVVYSTDDRVIEVTTMAKAGHLYKLRYTF
jgi:GntR family transcriptional regulator